MLIHTPINSNAILTFVFENTLKLNGFSNVKPAAKFFIDPNQIHHPLVDCDRHIQSTFKPFVFRVFL